VSVDNTLNLLANSLKLFREATQKRAVIYAKESAKQIQAVARGLLGLPDSVAGLTVTTFATLPYATEAAATYPGNRTKLTSWTKTVTIPTGDAYRLVLDGGFYYAGTLTIYVDGVAKFTYVSEGIYSPFEAVDLTAGDRTVSVTFSQDLAQAGPDLATAQLLVQKVVS